MVGESGTRAGHTWASVDVSRKILHIGEKTLNTECEFIGECAKSLSTCEHCNLNGIPKDAPYPLGDYCPFPPETVTQGAEA